MGREEAETVNKNNSEGSVLVQWTPGRGALTAVNYRREGRVYEWV